MGKIKGKRNVRIKVNEQRIMAIIRKRKLALSRKNWVKIIKQFVDSK